MVSISPDPPFDRPSLLVLEPDSDARDEYVGLLSGQFAITAVGSCEGALALLARTAPAVLLTDLSLPDGDGIEVCRAAKSLEAPPTVLVTTFHAEYAPDAIEAGCDSVLLKPFPPNLLLARLSRLARDRSQMLRMRATHQMARATHLHERSALVMNGTNRFWPTTHCPYCMHVGVTSFDYCMHRRAWYACLACKKVWIAARAE